MFIRSSRRSRKRSISADVAKRAACEKLSSRALTLRTCDGRLRGKCVCVCRARKNVDRTHRAQKFCNYRAERLYRLIPPPSPLISQRANFTNYRATTTEVVSPRQSCAYREQQHPARTERKRDYCRDIEFFHHPPPHTHARAQTPFSCSY